MKFFVSVLVTLVSIFTLAFSDVAEAQRQRERPGRGGNNQPGRRPDNRQPDNRRPDDRRPDNRRPDDRRPDNRRPDNNDRNERDRRDRQDRRRGEVRRDRDNRRHDRERYRSDRYSRRDSWRRQPHWVQPRRDNRIHDSRFWGPRYNVWLGIRTRPLYFSFSYNWRRPMPSSTTWSYIDIEAVADNIEDLTQDIFNRMSRANPNMSYGLRQTLADLADSAENFNDSVETRDDYNDTLYDLFYLDTKVNEAQNALRSDFYGNAVSNDMRALRYYVDEMLYTYRQNY
jgi:hypothetical protein